MDINSSYAPYSSATVIKDIEADLTSVYSLLDSCTTRQKAKSKIGIIINKLKVTKWDS